MCCYMRTKKSKYKEIKKHPNKPTCNQIDNSSSESSDDEFAFDFSPKSLKSADQTFKYKKPW